LLLKNFKASTWLAAYIIVRRTEYKRRLELPTLPTELGFLSHPQNLIKRMALNCFLLLTDFAISCKTIMVKTRWQQIPANFVGARLGHKYSKAHDKTLH
jgi:hypothetical protein